MNHHLSAGYICGADDDLAAGVSIIMYFQSSEYMLYAITTAITAGPSGSVGYPHCRLLPATQHNNSNK